MPKYTFASKDSKRKRLMVVECSIKDLDKIIKDNENDWVLVPTAPAIVSGVMSGTNKPSDAFRDKLREIKKTLPKRYRDNVNTF